MPGKKDTGMVPTRLGGMKIIVNGAAVLPGHPCHIPGQPLLNQPS